MATVHFDTSNLHFQFSPTDLGCVLKKTSKITPNSSAMAKIKHYEFMYRNEDSSMPRPNPIPVEDTFDDFVRTFGGYKISDLIEKKSQMPLNADYFFPDHNVIAELKTLEGIYSGPNAFKQFSQAYIDSGCTGSDVMGFFFRGEEVPQTAADLMKKRVRRSIEQRIKQARKQLKKSKTFFGNEDTKLIILIAMDQTPLFGHRTMLYNLAKVMEDNYADEHTDGVVYLNPNTATSFNDDGMDFSGWYPFYRDDEVNDGLSNFVDLLGNRWLTHYGNKIGNPNPILELASIDDLPGLFR